MKRTIRPAADQTGPAAAGRASALARRAAVNVTATAERVALAPTPGRGASRLSPAGDGDRSGRSPVRRSSPRSRSGGLRRSRVLVVVAAIAAVLAVAAAGLTLVGRPASDGRHPRSWDDRVGQLALFVEREQGLRFLHPVAVDFLPPAELDRMIRNRVMASGGADRVAATRWSALRALGLVSGLYDPAAAAGLGAFGGSESVPAHYDPTTGRIIAPDVELGPRQRATLVHVLTHALQDQHLGLQATAARTAGGQVVWGLAEGDAVRIERAYLAQLTDTDRARMAGEQVGPATVEPLVHGPWPLASLRQVADLLGEGFAETLRVIDGPGGVDAALRTPPVSDEALFDPVHYRGKGLVAGPSSPSWRAGERVLDEGTFGPLLWYLLVASTSDIGTALRAATGWGGDRYLVVRSDNRDCLRVIFRGDRSQDVTELQQALQPWVSTEGATGRDVALVGDQLALTACDPGPDALGAPAPGAAVLAAPRIALDTAAGLRQERAMPFEQARCTALDLVAAAKPDALARAASSTTPSWRLVPSRTPAPAPTASASAAPAPTASASAASASASPAVVAPPPPSVCG